MLILGFLESLQQYVLFVTLIRNPGTVLFINFDNSSTAQSSNRSIVNILGGAILDLAHIS